MYIDFVLPYFSGWLSEHSSLTVINEHAANHVTYVHTQLGWRMAYVRNNSTYVAHSLPNSIRVMPLAIS